MEPQKNFNFNRNKMASFAALGPSNHSREEREEKIYEERRGKKKLKQRPQQNLHLQGQNPTSVQ